MFSVKGRVDRTAQQFEDTLLKALKQTDPLLLQYIAKLIKEEFDEDRRFILEDYGPAIANGSIVFTHKVAQPAIIDCVNVNIDSNKSANLTIGRFTQQITNTQTRNNILAPVRYLVGPGDIIALNYTVAMASQSYMAIFGFYIGSRFA